MFIEKKNTWSHPHKSTPFFTHTAELFSLRHKWIFRKTEGGEGTCEHVRQFQFNPCIASIKHPYCRFVRCIIYRLQSINHYHCQHWNSVIEAFPPHFPSMLMVTMSVSISYFHFWDMIMMNWKIEDRLKVCPILAHPRLFLQPAHGCYYSMYSQLPHLPPSTSLPPTHSMRSLNVYYCCGGDSVSRPPGKY